ncbi:MAG TPA: AAA family ATPase, partial [Terriglobales bacterium]|nr:AAA family ATPase [Terriglobales bacterium]
MPGFIQLGTFTLDLERQRLFHLGEPVALRPKTSVVLCCLAQRPGKFVSADELQQSAWPGLTVTPQTLTNVIGELRKLSRMDDPAVLLIETRYGEGYRLLIDSPRRPPPAEPLAADATRGPLVEEKAAQLSAAPRAEISASNRLFVGREAQLAQLRQLWSLALTGQRQVVFLGGMAGIGKTALVQVFIDWLKQSQAPAAQTSLVAVGRCRARHGEAESYAPLLDALEQISLDVDLIADLRRCAPSWLAQMPWLLPSAEMTTLRQSLAGIGTLRVRREGVKLFEEISLRLPLLLLIDDLHDADDATIDLLAALIERTTPARLMIVATHRHPDPSLRAGPLKTLLAGWRRSAGVHRILLDPLPRPAVHAYL